MEEKVKVFHEYFVKYAEKDFDSITDEEYEDNKTKKNEFSELVYRSAGPTNWEEFNPNFINLVFSILLN